MLIEPQVFYVNDIHYLIRSAVTEDAEVLTKLRTQIDGETENMDREEGEGLIDKAGFERLIQEDNLLPRNLFLVAAVDNQIVGFSRCEGTYLKRFSHKVEFGVCVLKAYWGCGIGKNLLQTCVSWADANEIKKMTLNVLETNDKAIYLYERFGFEVEGILKADRWLSDGLLYNTVVMGRISR